MHDYIPKLFEAINKAILLDAIFYNIKTKKEKAKRFLKKEAVKNNNTDIINFLFDLLKIHAKFQHFIIMSLSINLNIPKNYATNFAQDFYLFKRELNDNPSTKKKSQIGINSFSKYYDLYLNIIPKVQI